MTTAETSIHKIVQFAPLPIREMANQSVPLDILNMFKIEGNWMQYDMLIALRGELDLKPGSDGVVKMTRLEVLNTRNAIIAVWQEDPQTVGFTLPKPVDVTLALLETSDESMTSKDFFKLACINVVKIVMGRLRAAANSKKPKTTDAVQRELELLPEYVRNVTAVLTVGKLYGYTVNVLNNYTELGNEYLHAAVLSKGLAIQIDPAIYAQDLTLAEKLHRVSCQ